MMVSLNWQGAPRGGGRGWGFLRALVVLVPALGLSAPGLLYGESGGAREKGALKVVCSVKGATVRVDGVVLGKTPLPVLWFRPGTHSVRITRSGYQEYLHSVTLRGGEERRLEVELVSTGAEAPEEPAPEDPALEDPALEELPAPASGDTGDDGLDDLALEPLEVEADPPPDEPELELELEPLEIELEPLIEVPASLPGAGASKESGPVPSLLITQAVPPAPVWYQDWRVLTGAGAAVVVGAVAAVYLFGGEARESGPAPVDLDHTLCGEARGCDPWAAALMTLMGR